jgi:plastocyanin
MSKAPAAWTAVALASVVAAIAPAAASAKERLLTLYSPKIDSLPYVHDTHQVTLRPDGHEAPAQPGYITGWKEQVLVDSKRPDAKPLPLAKMMVHHFLYFAPGRLDEAPGSCWRGAGFIGGRGEEHPHGHLLRQPPGSYRDTYGITNRLPDGSAPTWRLTAMVMNHYKKPKSFYVRTKVWYTTEKRKPIWPVVIGNCAQLANGMSYDVPGGGKRGSNFVDSSEWVAPFSGRMLLASSHQHGGGKYHVLESRTCKRRLFKAPVYYGPPNHVYNTIRPILHEPGPIGTGTYATAKGVPVVKGEVLRRVAVHDDHNLHVAAMGFWATWFVPDDSVERCGPMPDDVIELNRPKRFDRTPDYDLEVPQLARPRGAMTAFSGNPLDVGDDFFRPGKVTAKVGETVSWTFGGDRPHSVTVANGPRGFSSVYWGRTSGTYSVTPKVPGTYRLVCLVHPTTMAQTLVVRR